MRSDNTDQSLRRSLRRSIDSEESDDARLAMSRVSWKPQIGGAVAVLLGIFLLVFFPRAPHHAGLDLHQMAMVFIVIGVFLMGAGTFARWYYLD